MDIYVIKDKNKTTDEIVVQLYDALMAANTHLEWCGYGGEYEYEIAKSMGLPEQIDTALDLITKS